MKEVKFRQISIKNFLSIGDEPIDIKFEPGIHIITGINKDKEDSKNGVGKSTISDAIFFAIFGSPLRPIKKDVITNWVNKKECSVTITFDVINDGVLNKYILLRSLNPSRVQLLKDGEDVSRTIGKTNENIFEILGTTPEMFEQSVIMCLNQVEPFLAKTPAVKRKFIEDIFKIEVFGKMAKYMRDEYNEIKKLYDFEVEKIADLQSNLQIYTQQQAQQAEKKQIRLNDLEGRKNLIIDEINSIKTKVVDLKSKITVEGEHTKTLLNQALTTLKAKQKELLNLDRDYTKILAINQTTVLNLKSKIKELESLSDGVCPHCKQPYSESNKQEKKRLIEKHQTEICECEKIILDTETKMKLNHKEKDILEDKIDESQQAIKTIEIQELELSNTLSDLKQQENHLAQINKDINTVTQDNQSFDSVILELQTRLKTLTLTADEYKKKINLIETSKFIVSDEGVKNIIVKKMLKMLNGRLNYYLNKLDANCTCLFNEYFDEIITNNRGRECSYFNFSGGERKRIDLAMLFTFMDIRRMQSNIFVNIAMYDELLDTSLDSKGIENTLSILSERVINNKEAIYVISHKNEAAKHATGEIIYLEKENDITRRKPHDRFFTTNTI